MKLNRFVALIVTVALIAAGVPRFRTDLSAASRGETRGTQLTISGDVLHPDRTAVPNVRLRLGYLDKNMTVGEMVSDPNGAFSFEVTAPGVYVVEAFDANGVLAVSNPLMVSDSSLTTSLILQQTGQPGAGAGAFFTSTAFLVISGIIGAVIIGFVVAGGSDSPEQ